MHSPKLSVVMPVHNSEAYLEEAVCSILDQSFADFELIAVNDGSTDGSAALLDRLASRDGRIIVLHQDNSGVPKALNAGIARARGAYVARMDADDIAWPDRFALQVARLDACPDIVALGTQFRLVDPEGRMLKASSVPLDHASLDGQLMRDQSLAICHPSVMMRRDVLIRVGAYRESFSSAQDIDLFLRLAEVGELANLDTVLLDYRMHPDSIGYSKRATQMQMAWQAGKDAADRRNLPYEKAPPHAQPDQRDHADICRLWGWWALGAGNVKTARHYARLAVMHAPFSRQNWWLAIIALRGR